jgi:tetrahydromethanopterin S-methyltransferase subunit G
MFKDITNLGFIDGVAEECFFENEAVIEGLTNITNPTFGLTLEVCQDATLQIGDTGCFVIQVWDKFCRTSRFTASLALTGSLDYESSEAMSDTGLFSYSKEIDASNRFDDTGFEVSLSDNDDNNGLSIGAKIGIIFGSIIGAILITATIFLVKRGYGNKQISNTSRVNDIEEDPNVAYDDTEMGEVDDRQNQLSDDDKIETTEDECFYVEEGEKPSANEPERNTVMSSNENEQYQPPMMKPGDCPMKGKFKMNSFRRWRYAHRM